MFALVACDCRSDMKANKSKSGKSGKKPMSKSPRARSKSATRVPKQAHKRSRSTPHVARAKSHALLSKRATKSNCGKMHGAFSHDTILERRGYKMGAELGEGSYAKVFKALSERHKGSVAIKIIDHSKAPEDFRDKFIPRELRIHRNLKHDNVIQLLDLFRVQSKTYMVLELAGHGDLLDYVRLRGVLGEAEAKFMFRQLCEAMQHMHKCRIVHRDMKCENVLLDSYNNVKISDFGFARRIDEGILCKTYCGSTAYCAPEILKGIPYKARAYDMWSTGVILFILLNGTMPFDQSNIRKMVKNQEAKRIPFSIKVKGKISNEAISLVIGLLEPDPGKRLTVQQTLQSPWLKDVPYHHRTSVPGERTLREPFPLPARSRSKTKRTPTAKRTNSKKGRGTKTDDMKPGDALPDGFIPSSMRTAFVKPKVTRSHNKAQNQMQIPCHKIVRNTPSGGSKQHCSEISYYDTDMNLKKRVKANAFV